MSKTLTRLYSELSDVVNGRYSKLSNVQAFSIEYNVESELKQIEGKTVLIGEKENESSD